MRNRIRFENATLNIASIVHSSVSAAHLAGTLCTLPNNNSTKEFIIMKALSIVCLPPTAPKIKEIKWHPPSHNFIKINTDGCALGAPGHASCGGIFRDPSGASRGCFASYLGIENAFFAELMGVILAINIAMVFEWKHIWLECDSMLVILALSNPSIVPWRLRTHWANMLLDLSAIQFFSTHVYREGNQCADHLASIGVSSRDTHWWQTLPPSMRALFIRDRHGLPHFRFK